MEFTDTFRVDSDIDTTFQTLTDLGKVAPCMPGAVLEDQDGETYRGRIKVRVGPMQMVFTGTARLTEVDADAKRGRIEASGRDTRGSGRAEADVVATLEEDGTGTLVTVVTDLTITGKAAQFGRGVLADVGSKILSMFADNLQRMLEEGADEPQERPSVGQANSVTAAPGTEASGTSARSDQGTVPASRRAEPRTTEALNLVEVAGAATLKRGLPLIVGLGIAAAIVWWVAVRRTSRRN